MFQQVGRAGGGFAGCDRRRGRVGRGTGLHRRRGHFGRADDRAKKEAEGAETEPEKLLHG